MYDPQSSKELIKLIENDALRDIKDIDITPENEQKIELKSIYEWYIETEKLIRILANILPSTMAQPINQLRYAGHHILKASQIKGDNTPEKKSNLIEAYKHCKRGYYDAIDLYVFHTTTTFKEKLSFLPKEEVKKHSQALKSHIAKVNQSRLEKTIRAEYYQEVSQNIINGLSLIHDINMTMSNHGITRDCVKERKDLINENRELHKQVDVKIQKGEREFNRKAFWVSMLVLIVTGIGLIFEGFGTQHLSESNVKLIITETPVIQHQELDDQPSR